MNNGTMKSLNTPLIPSTTVSFRVGYTTIAKATRDHGQRDWELAVNIFSTEEDDSIREYWGWDTASCATLEEAECVAWELIQHQLQKAKDELQFLSRFMTDADGALPLVFQYRSSSDIVPEGVLSCGGYMVGEIIINGLGETEFALFGIDNGTFVNREPLLAPRHPIESGRMTRIELEQFIVNTWRKAVPYRRSIVQSIILLEQYFAQKKT